VNEVAGSRPLRARRPQIGRTTACVTVALVEGQVRAERRSVRPKVERESQTVSRALALVFVAS